MPQVTMTYAVDYGPEEEETHYVRAASKGL